MRFAPVPAPNAVATPPRATRMQGCGSLVTGPKGGGRGKQGTMVVKFTGKKNGEIMVIHSETINGETMVVKQW